MSLCTCVIDNLYGDKNGSHGASIGWGHFYAGCLRNEINKERIEIGRSPDRQANKAIPTMVYFPKGVKAGKA